MSERRNYSNNRNRNPRNYQRNRDHNKKESNKKEYVIKVENEANYDKREELISGYIFDSMYAIQDGKEQIYIRSQGKAINMCAILTLKLEERLKDQLISYRKKITINSRFLRDKKQSNYKGNRQKRPEFNPNKPNILSFLDVKIFIKK